MKSLIMSIFFLLATAAQAAVDVPLMQIQSEASGDDIAYLGIQVSETSTSIYNLTYQEKAEGAVRAFSITGLNKDKETIIKQGPVKVVEISANSMSRSSFILTIHYIYEYKLMGSDKREKQLKVEYVSPVDQYQISDVDTQKVINRAFFYVNQKNGKQVGIAKIETW